MRTIRLKKTTVTLRSDGILHIHINGGKNMDLNDAVETLEAMMQIGKGKKYPVLIDAGEFASVDKEVRIFAASKEANLYTLADAIAYHSFAQKLIGKFYVANNKPVVPTRVFPDIEEAVEWLHTFIP